MRTSVSASRWSGRLDLLRPAAAGLVPSGAVAALQPWKPRCPRAPSCCGRPPPALSLRELSLRSSPGSRATLARLPERRSTPVAQKVEADSDEDIRVGFKMVGATGFEPATSWSRTKRSTRLSHAPGKTGRAYYLKRPSPQGQKWVRSLWRMASPAGRRAGCGVRSRECVRWRPGNAWSC
jgi:hypothetical protein